MPKKRKSSLFNTIAPFYALYYQYQRKHYREVLTKVEGQLKLTSYETVFDVGCGTGALASALKDRGLRVTGIDPAEKMLEEARKRPENAGIEFLQASALEHLPFEDKHFDLSIASYVAHGLQKEQRKRMYAEMSRVTKSKVIIYDYNRKHSLATSFVEWLEGGDYFNFIKDPRSELEQCMNETKHCFSEVEVVDVDGRAAWYVCTPL